MKKLFALLMVWGMVVLCGCAKTPSRSEYTEMNVAPHIEADADSGIVYFLRESAFFGGGISYYIWEDTQKVGLLRSGSYFVHKATIGQHTYWAETESKAFVTLKVDAGKTYYVVGGVGMGMWAGRPTLEIVTEPVASGLLPDLKYTRLSTEEEQEQYKAKQQKKSDSL